MNPWLHLGVVWIGMALAMSAGWLWQRRHDNAGIVDVIWASGVGASAIYYALVGDGATLPRVLVAALAGIWSARLAGHLWKRVRGGPEDGRYRQLRSHWHGSQWKFFLVFQFQALLVVLFSLPFLAVVRNPERDFNLLLAIGIGIWIASIAGEWIADRQLARFVADPANKGRTCRDGLWRYSRHPNYFFEFVHWFAYLFLAAASPWHWLACSGPLVMYVFLRWISGVPYTEAQALRTRGDDYREYQRTTPMLIPWFPKRSTQ